MQKENVYALKLTEAESQGKIYTHILEKFVYVNRYTVPYCFIFTETMRFST